MVFSVIGTGFSQFAERRPEPMIPETQQMNGGTEIFFFFISGESLANTLLRNTCVKWLIEFCCSCFREQILK